MSTSNVLQRTRNLRSRVEGRQCRSATAFGPESAGETTYAERMLDRLTRGMLVLLDTGFDGWPCCISSAPPGRFSCAGPGPGASL
ncbi:MULTISPECIES: hypothetical protein [Streptomyces]|uniref:hypothetical protein n=1 Tax=Streptomyces TaxID=1883 RepID=UPI00344A8C7A